MHQPGGCEVWWYDGTRKSLPIGLVEIFGSRSHTLIETAVARGCELWLLLMTRLWVSISSWCLEQAGNAFRDLYEFFWNLADCKGGFDTVMSRKQTEAWKVFDFCVIWLVRRVRLWSGRGGCEGREAWGGVRWTIGECVRCDIWGKGADTDQHSDGLRIIRISLNVWLETH